MSIFSNTPDGYRPFPAHDPNLFSADPLTAPIYENGLYFRYDSGSEEYEKLTGELLSGTDLVPFQKYQYWAEAAWKTQQGSFDSAARFISKINEEHTEFYDAINYLRGQPASTQPELTEEVILEAGDVLWCISALASNARSDIDAGMRTLLFSYVRGVQHIDVDPNSSTGKMMSIKPRWRDTAASLAIKPELLTFGDFDLLMQAGFEPLPSTVMNIFYPSEANEDIAGHLFMMVGRLAALASLHNQQFAYGDRITDYPDDVVTIVMPDQFDKFGREIAIQASCSLLETLYVLNQVSPGIKTAEIIRKNVAKLAERVATQKVDKTDGQR